MEYKIIKQDNNYKRILKIAMVTDRNTIPHERKVHILKNMGIEINQVFSLRGIAKLRALNIMKPHMFFYDQIAHLEHINKVHAVYIPFGTTNKIYG